MKKLIELKGVSKIYKRGENTYKALDNINLKIDQGKFVVILGPSGAGKSTLLNLLGGMDRPTKGSIIVGEKDLTKLTEKELTKYRAEDVGFIFQFYNLMPTLTVKENVDLVRDVTTTTKNTDEVLKEVGLYRERDKFPNELSGGEEQRTSISRAVLKNPKLLLCDEPTGALDSKTGENILKLLKRQTDEDTTVIVVTHNSLISEISDIIINIKNGQIESIKENKNIKKVEEVNW